MTAPLHPWVNPGRPRARLHLDFAGPFMGKWFLILVDAFSKSLEVHPMHAATTRATVKILQNMFATHGIPHVMVTDNGCVFTSVEFGDFMRGNRITHVTSAPYHPATYGLAERAVQTFKGAMKKMETEYSSLESKVDRFLFRYRLTPHATTGEPPAVLFMGRRPRSRLDLMHPDLAQKILLKLQRQKQDHDKTCRERTFKVGQHVFVRNFSKRCKWLPGTILERTGPVSFCCELTDGTVVRRHQDQMRNRITTGKVGELAPAPGADEEVLDDLEDGTVTGRASISNVQNPADASVGQTAEPEEKHPRSEEQPTSSEMIAPTMEPVIRRSSRTSKPPDRLNF